MEDLTIIKYPENMSIEEELHFLLRNSYEDSKQWCGCTEGDLREYFDDRRDEAVDDIMQMLIRRGMIIESK